MVWGMIRALGVQTRSGTLLSCVIWLTCSLQPLQSSTQTAPGKAPAWVRTHDHAAADGQQIYKRVRFDSLRGGTADGTEQAEPEDPHPSGFITDPWTLTSQSPYQPDQSVGIGRLSRKGQKIDIKRIQEREEQAMDNVGQEMLRAMELDPSDPAKILAYIEWLQKRRRSAEEGRIYLKQVMKLAPSDPVALNARAVLLEETKASLKEVRDAYKKAIAYSKGDQLAQVQRNYAQFLFRRTDDLKDAAFLWKKSLAMNPTDADTLVSYAGYLAWDHNFQMAERLLRQAVAICPNHSEGLTNLGVLLEAVKGDLSWAGECYKRAIEVDPRNPEALCNLGHFAQTVLQDPELAEQAYKGALSVDANHSSTLSNYGSLLYRHFQQREAAMEMYERSLKADPKDDTTMFNYAHIASSAFEDSSKVMDLYKVSV
eukprot:CAMPEP_0184308716 /NCGR_PEP_ID=MMETSP1049-20130417/17092_1 /TAXON_ID=77928 /ORGANISM="Proteomonas sulcata, Strain CCMP704" /LENGTH=426 /DNA_ID=CAMNT_0026621451 /DNA_START=155 /DNA_END=1435 /DNA_ORIENTATION=+